MSGLWSLGGVTIVVEEDSGDIQTPRWGLLNVLDSELSTIAHYIGEEGIKRDIQFVLWSGYHDLIQPMINGSGYALISDQGLQGDYIILSSKPERLQDLSRIHAVYRARAHLLRSSAIGTGEVLGAAGHGGFAYTTTAISGNSPPLWIAGNTGLSDSTFVPSLSKNPNDPVQAVCLDNSGGVFLNTNWREGTTWTSILTLAEAETLIETAISLSIEELELADVKWLATGIEDQILVVANYQVEVARYTRVLKSGNLGASWICGGAIPGYGAGGNTEYSYHYLPKGGAGVGELVHDGDYLYIVASSPHSAEFRLPTINRSSDWGGSWGTPVIGATSEDEILDPACARTATDETLYIVPWGKDNNDGGGFASGKKIHRGSSCCTGAHENIVGELAPIPANGTYDFSATASTNSHVCPKDPEINCNLVTLIPRVSCRKKGTAQYLFQAQPYSYIGSHVLTSGTIYEFIVDQNEATSCCFMVDGEIFVTGPQGAEIWTDPEVAVVSAISPDDTGDISVTKALAADDGYARYRGMLSILADNSWAALQISPSGTETSQTKLEIDGSLKVTLDRPFREIQGFEYNKDIIYLGRSWVSGEAADVQSEVVYLSQDNGLTFSDITGNITLTSVTGLITDQGED